MTRELLQICPKMVAVLEGGYNTDYLGQHAAAVVSAMLDVEPEDMQPSQADKDAQIFKVSDITKIKAKDWAEEDVSLTRDSLKPFWKSL